VAGKTGTSEGGRDLWFIGSIPQLTTGLWLGYDNNRATQSTSAVAAAAWYDYMAPIVKDLPVRQFPPKPVLTGRFNPLKTLQPNRGEQPQSAPTGDWSWRPQPEASRWTPNQAPIPEGTPAPATPAAATPAPAAPSAPAAPASSPPPPLAPPPPASPSAPPPLP